MEPAGVAYARDGARTSRRPCAGSAVLEGKDVDAVPLDPATVPGVAVAVHSLTTSAVARVQTASSKREVRAILEDPRDVRADVVSVHALARGVVLEDHSRSVEGEDRLDVVGVPGVVVALDGSLELGSRSTEYRTVSTQGASIVMAWTDYLTNVDVWCYGGIDEYRSIPPCSFRRTAVARSTTS